LPIFGYPPFFVGELASLQGRCPVAVRLSRRRVRVRTEPPARRDMGWTLLRTLPFVGTYGFDSLRDSVIIMYGGFSFIIAALLIEDCRRINTLIRYYRIFLGIYVPAVPFLFPLSFYFGDDILKVPGTTVSLIWARPWRGRDAPRRCRRCCPGRFSASLPRSGLPVFSPRLVMVSAVSARPCSHSSSQLCWQRSRSEKRACSPSSSRSG